MTTESQPSGKRYEQWCPVSRALDVVGERWTLLVVRSLLIGPQRYTDLRNALPGIATDLLTARLRTLEQAGFVTRRELPPPTPATVYELTESGWRLGPVVLALAKVGLDRLGAPDPEEPINGSSITVLLRASFDAERAGDAHASYQLELGDERFTVTVADGRVGTARGHADDVSCTISTSPRLLAELLAGSVNLEAALASGALRLDGPRACLDEFVRNFSYPGARQ
jgi:DNA-binding HxlR family transcriptional regulator